MTSSKKKTASNTRPARAKRSAEAEERILKLPLRAICPDPDQPRQSMDADAIKTLAASMKAEGQLQPIVVRKAPAGVKVDYMIVFGERRWRAAALNKAKTIDAVVRTYRNTELPDVLATQFIENYEREDMTLTDQVHAIGRLADLVGNKAVAQKTGRPTAWVSKMVGIYRGGDATHMALSATLTRDLESLYQLARLEKKTPEKAQGLVTGWLQQPSGQQDLRRQIKAALSSSDSATVSAHAPAQAGEPAKRSTQASLTSRKAQPRTSAAEDVYRCKEATREGRLVKLNTNFGELVFDASIIKAIQALKGGK